MSIAVPHPVFYGQSGSPQNVTIKEFETTCATPTTQGFDAHIFEVPAAYQKLNAAVAAKGTAGAYDLDLFFYDSSCAITGASQAEGTDELGVMPAGTVWVAMHNYLGDPNVSAYIELRPTDF